jgi:hypothetical protein
LAPLKSIEKGILGTNSLKILSLYHGHSFKNLRATSKVAPPHISNAKRLFKHLAVAGAIFCKSYVLTLVASKD